eukprot:Gregarina_sp_Poly_1__10754@NODE_821_length_6140_cov_16_345299_g594_i0_p3_GENE_NODE_821_length_6140_cov_16_345299_g594_i0NODE_821_length_6140_cov_16_345299_g594_i0_p3_ORF_typecomplete_len118_score5_51_NODE_821_length_6140_cov_16_345299_g594_i08991252
MRILHSVTTCLLVSETLSLQVREPISHKRFNRKRFDHSKTEFIPSLDPTYVRSDSSILSDPNNRLRLPRAKLWESGDLKQLVSRTHQQSKPRLVTFNPNVEVISETDGVRKWETLQD